jgi:hypothetical protein
MSQSYRVSDLYSEYHRTAAIPIFWSPKSFNTGEGMNPLYSVESTEAAGQAILYSGQILSRQLRDRILAEKGGIEITVDRSNFSTARSEIIVRLLVEIPMR